MLIFNYNGLGGSVLTVDATNANVQAVRYLKDCGSFIFHYPSTALRAIVVPNPTANIRTICVGS